MTVNGVLGERIAELGVLNRLIGRDVTFAGDVGADEWKHVVFLAAFASERARRVAALNEGHDGGSCATRFGELRIPSSFLNVGGMGNWIGKLKNL